MGAGPVIFSVEQQNLLWAMRRDGESIREMERKLGETMPRMRLFLRQSGGIAPIPRRRRSDHLTLADREEVSRGIASGLSARSIAGTVNRTPSRRCHGRLPATAAATDTGHWTPIRPRTSGRGVLNQASWLPTPCCGRWSPPSWTRTGLRSKSPSGCREHIPRMSRCESS